MPCKNPPALSRPENFAIIAGFPESLNVLFRGVLANKVFGVRLPYKAHTGLQ